MQNSLKSSSTKNTIEDLFCALQRSNKHVMNNRQCKHTYRMKVTENIPTAVQIMIIVIIGLTIAVPGRSLMQTPKGRYPLTGLHTAGAKTR